jgi:hypothetical protein
VIQSRPAGDPGSPDSISGLATSTAANRKRNGPTRGQRRLMTQSYAPPVNAS